MNVVKILIVGIFLNSIAITAKENKAVFTIFDTETSHFEKVSSKGLKERFLLKGEMILLDNNGKLLSHSYENRGWKFGSSDEIEGNWAFSDKEVGEFGIQHKWHITKEGLLKASVEEFDLIKKKNNYSSDVVLGKSLFKKDFILKDFEPIVWRVKSIKDKKLIIRFIPKIEYEEKEKSLSDFEISLESPVIYDTQNNLWGSFKGSISGKFLALKTNKGLISMSLYKFKDSEKIGYIEKGQLIIKDNKQKIYIRGENNFQNIDHRIVIYGHIFKERKSGAKHRTGWYSSSEEEVFLQQISLK